MHIRKSFALVVLTVLAAPHMRAEDEKTWKCPFVSDYATEVFTVNGAAWDGFVLPFADDKVTSLVPDSVIVGGITTHVVVKALTRAVLNAALAQVMSADAWEAFTRTLVGELGYAGAQEVINQLGLNFLEGKHKENFDTFAAPYLKRVLAVALLDAVGNVSNPFGGSDEAAPEEAPAVVEEAPVAVEAVA